jgi:hypothetical protein
MAMRLNGFESTVAARNDVVSPKSPPSAANSIGHLWRRPSPGPIGRMTVRDPRQRLDTRPCHRHPPTGLVRAPLVIVVNTASPYPTLANLLDAARAKPRDLTLASFGPAPYTNTPNCIRHAQAPSHG